MKYKARIKSMSIENTSRRVVFEPLDRIMVCNEPHYLAIDSGKVVELPMSGCSFYIDKARFDFLSQHSKEEFVIEIDSKNDASNKQNNDASDKQNNDASDKQNNDASDKQNNVTCDNKYYVIKIELIYG